MITQPSVQVGVFTRTSQPSRGRCPACGAVQDDRGCRVLKVVVIDVPAAQGQPGAPEHHELRTLLLAHPVGADVACCDPALLEAQRQWAAANLLAELDAIEAP